MIKPILQLKVFLAAGLLVLCAGFSGCGTSNDSKPDNSTQKQLLTADLNELSSYKNAGAVEYDQENSGIFSQIFGGTTGADLTNYLNLRVHYYIDGSEDVSVTPSDFPVEGWTEQIQRKSFFSSASGSDGDVTSNAVNESIEYWILGLINNVTVTFNIQGESVPLTSARTGIIYLDTGYSDTIQYNGNPVAMPSFYRQSILLHEARHSDCTGGLSQAQLNRISQAHSSAEFSAGEEAGTCGHLHVMCSSGQYQGLYACDDEAFGAYGVQNIFLQAQLLQMGIDGEDLGLADLMQIDAQSRLPIEDDNSQYPDMSSTDSISP